MPTETGASASTESAATSADVIVIGAGVSGLAAAQGLIKYVQYAPPPQKKFLLPCQISLRLFLPVSYYYMY